MSDKIKSKIISLTEVLESKIAKENELEFYYEQLKEIQRKIAFLETDLNLTKQIIKLIETEKIIEINNDVPLLNFEDEDNE